MQTNLFAYTAEGSEYPGYVSINRLDDGRVSVTVREAPVSGTEAVDWVKPGAVAEFIMPADAWPEG